MGLPVMNNGQHKLLKDFIANTIINNKDALSLPKVYQPEPPNFPLAISSSSNPRARSTYLPRLQSTPHLQLQRSQGAHGSREVASYHIVEQCGVVPLPIPQQVPGRTPPSGPRATGSGSPTWAWKRAGPTYGLRFGFECIDESQVGERSMNNNTICTTQFVNKVKHSLLTSFRFRVHG